MRRATHVIPASDASDIHAGAASASVTLTFDDRYRRRIRLTDDAGKDFLLDLSEATRIAHGDRLVLEGEGTLLVLAADEAVAEIHCPGRNQAAQIAWHLGNRHTPVQILDNGDLRIRFDHVLVKMMEGLGASVVQNQAAFDPEPGAYGGEPS
jgi:urease accessory protein